MRNKCDHRSRLLVTMDTSLLLLVTFLFIVSPVRCDDGPVVTVAEGELLGTTMESLDGNTFFAFHAIPYAEPPVGKRRFKAPVKATRWNGVRDATQESEICAQVPLMGDDFIGSEDCLYLNVYTPKLEGALPVVVWIHGGAFYAGDGGLRENGPQLLMDQPIILVTINYRLGPFGFLSSGDQVIPGNFGMKDQVMALQWVQDNIEVFGGDKTRVTLHGYSSGAVCVHAHLFSPMSKGLFHRAVIQSGSMNNECTFRPRPAAVLHVLSALLECPHDKDTEQQLKCLKNKSASELAKATNKFPWWAVKIPQVYTPIVEWAGKDGDWQEEPFLSEHPDVLIAEKRVPNDVPIITGFTQDEGTPMGLMVSKDPDLMDRLYKHFDTVGRLGFCLYGFGPKKMNRIKKFYFGDTKIDASKIGNITQLYGDSMFSWGQVRSASGLAAANSENVYFYLFTFQGRISEVMAFGYPQPMGIGHADDLAYLFRRPVNFPDGIPNEEEKNTIKRMGKILANFAATGEPTPEDDSLFPEQWQPLPRNSQTEPSKFRYFEISSEPSMKLGRPFPERMNFWEKLTKPKKTTQEPSIIERDEL